MGESAGPANSNRQNQLLSLDPEVAREGSSYPKSELQLEARDKQQVRSCCVLRRLQTVWYHQEGLKPNKVQSKNKCRSKQTPVLPLFLLSSPLLVPTFT